MLLGRVLGLLVVRASTRDLAESAIVTKGFGIPKRRGPRYGVLSQH